LHPYKQKQAHGTTCQGTPLKMVLVHLTGLESALAMQVETDERFKNNKKSLRNGHGRCVFSHM